MLRISVKKLDRRYDGHDLFTHRANFDIKGLGDKVPYALRFVELRQYLWNKWGPSIEHELFWIIKRGAVPCPLWAWHGEEFKFYLRDQALTEFLLIKERYEID